MERYYWHEESPAKEKEQKEISKEVIKLLEQYSKLSLEEKCDFNIILKDRNWINL